MRSPFSFINKQLLFLHTFPFMVAGVVFVYMRCCFAPSQGGAPLPSQDVLQPDMAQGEYEFVTSAFNTDCRLVLFGERYKVHQAYAQCSQRLFALHNTLNAFDPNSELARFNQAPPETPVPLSPLFWRAFSAASFAFQETQGAFDVTIAPLMHFWKEVAKTPEAPENQGNPLEERRQRLMEAVGFSRLAWDDNAHTVTKPAQETQLDFGGLAKGLALDILRETLAEEGIEYYYISLGGNTLQQLPPNHPFQNVCALADMREGQEGKEACTVSGTHGLCLATSANTLRPIAPASAPRPMGHILNPQDGSPVAPPYRSVTAVCDTGWRSDAYSTAVFVQGAPLAESLLKANLAKGFILLPADDSPPLVLGDIQLLP